MSETPHQNPERTTGQVSEWDELGKLNKDGSYGESSVQAPVETPDQRAHKVSEAAERVREAYKADRGNVALSLPNVEKDIQIQGEIHPKHDTIASRYDAHERTRVERLKSEIVFMNMGGGGL